MFKQIAIKEEDHRRLISRKGATNQPIWFLVNLALDAYLGANPFQPRQQKKNTRK